MNLSEIVLVAITLMISCAHSAYYPDDSHTQQRSQSPPQQAPYPDEPATPRIAWLEYLGHVYIEVYNYQRAQRCIDEMRRLSGISLGDASLTRLAIEGLSRRMIGFKRSPPKNNILKRIKRAITGPSKKERGRTYAAAQQQYDYNQRLLAGDSGMWGEARAPPASQPLGGYYSMGTPLRPAPSSGVESSQAAAMRRMIECPNCPQYSNPFEVRQGQPAPIPNLYNHAGTMAAAGGQLQSSPSVYGQPQGGPTVYGQPAVGIKSTDGIHDLLFHGRVQEANALFSRLIQNSTSSQRPVYRIELALSLIDLDLTEPNDCVPLWDAAWRLSWRDKLRIVDIYRSCRRAQRLDDNLFASIARLRFQPQIVARIKTIVGAPDAMSLFSRVPTKPDFYWCASCWARKRIGGGEGWKRMQKVLIRAEHDAGLGVEHRRYFSQMLQSSFRPDRFDGRVGFFQSIFPRNMAFSVVTGAYSGLYEYDEEQGLPSPYAGYFGRTGSPGLGSNYRALKNPNPVPLDRQNVLLDAFADGSPEQLAVMMNEHRHELVKEILETNPHLSLNNMLQQFRDIERQTKLAKKQEKKDRKLAKKRRKEWEKAVKEGRVTDEQVEAQERIEREREEMVTARNGLLERLQAMLGNALRAEAHVEGSDQFGMSFHDFGSQPVAKREHKKLLDRIRKAQKEVSRFSKGDRKDQKIWDQQQEYLADMERSQEAMSRAHRQLDDAEHQMTARYQFH